MGCGPVCPVWIDPVGPHPKQNTGRLLTGRGMGSRRRGGAACGKWPVDDSRSANGPSCTPPWRRAPRSWSLFAGTAPHLWRTDSRLFGPGHSRWQPTCGPVGPAAGSFLLGQDRTRGATPSRPSPRVRRLSETCPPTLFALDSLSSLPQDCWNLQFTRCPVLLHRQALPGHEESRRRGSSRRARGGHRAPHGHPRPAPQVAGNDRYRSGATGPLFSDWPE